MLKHIILHEHNFVVDIFANICRGFCEITLAVYLNGDMDNVKLI